MPDSQLRVILPKSQGGLVELISGHPLFARCWQGKSNQSIALCVHGAESHSGWFEPLAHAFQRVGIDTMAYDRMGWGQSPGDSGELSSLHDVYDELCSLIYILRERYECIHLLGLSWGGLYLLYAAKHLTPVVNSVIAISPGIYLRKPFGLTTAWDSLKNLYFERQWRFELLYQPQDFSQIDKQRDFIKVDPYRVKKIGPRFIAATALMQAVLKSRPYRSSSSTSSMVPQVVLASQDQLIDTQKTLELCEELEFGFRTVAGGHSLVLDAPEELALQIAKIEKTLPESEASSLKQTS